MIVDAAAAVSGITMITDVGFVSSAVSESFPSAKMTVNFLRGVGGATGGTSAPRAAPSSKPVELSVKPEARMLIDGKLVHADNGATFANVNPAAGYRGITAFIVERGADGFSVGKKEDKLGIRASSTCELLFEGCRVPKTSVLGEVGKGYKVAIETLNEGRIGIGAQMIGVAAGALKAATDYVKDRTQFGKKLADFQGIQFQLAQALPLAPGQCRRPDRADVQTAQVQFGQAGQHRHARQARPVAPALSHLPRIH